MYLFAGQHEARAGGKQLPLGEVSASQLTSAPY